ncbi:aldehyde dehydrogenase family protein (plasmid) [Rhizobium sp. CB3171]|uniref:aldehyde dehydrogenase family protein n=1 Tax=Rhizobium sp. CB3171 TaxID=3039157 RepID=UPI0024B06B30|nr:aldehyde dehydrogenase family protein [Rhizobium sp. CB3171]WFU06700.1 aldehyde dehydrogenase family protein [Rhizobium sp. CB3171]
MNGDAVSRLPRVTYSNLYEDFSGVNTVLDRVIPEVKGRLGREHANLIDGKDNRGGETYLAPCPVDRSKSLGTFFKASSTAVELAVEAAKRAYPNWRQIGWQKRVEIAERAAALLEIQKFEVAAACLLEVGKSRMEAIGEVEEAIDIIRFYSSELALNGGFARAMKRAQEREETIDVLRPYGVFAVIAPFNFPVALSIGMSICALLAGNTVVFKPSPMGGMTGRLIANCFMEAGFPEGVFNLINGDNETGAALVAHPGIDGVAFTGSHAVGMSIMRGFGTSGAHAKPVLAEMGGKNPTYVGASANIDIAISGMLRSAFGLQGQKCSAGSVVFLHESVKVEFMEKIEAAARALKIGDPYVQDVFMGPLINESARDRFLRAVEQAKAADGIVCGGALLTGSVYDNGYFAQPTIVANLPDDHILHRNELFLPFLTVRIFTDLGDAIARGNAVPYGLTAGIYTEDPDELELFLDTVEAGVLYANRASGATTGAWPGIQTFCGWKGSGTGSKGGLGSWYLPQFLREQSRTIMR